MIKKKKRNKRTQMICFKPLILYKWRLKLENSRRCDICNVHVHKASVAKHFESKKQLKIVKHEEMIIPEWLFQKPILKIPRRTYNPILLKIRA